MYQVVSELAKGHTKSETPEMLKSLFNKHSGLTRGIVMAVLSMSMALPVGVAVQADDAGTSETSGDTTGVTTTNKSVTVKDGAVLVGSGAVSVSSSTDTTKNTTTITIDVPTNGKVEASGTGLVSSGTVYTAVNEEQTAREAAVKSVTDKIGTLDANVKTNTDAINTNKNAITSLENLSNVSDAGKTVIKEQAKKAVKVAAGDRVTVISSGSETGDGTITYTVTANNNGSIVSGDTNLVSGGTMYTELRPDSTGTYYYISNANTTAANLIALDTNLKNVIDAIGLDADDTTTSYTSKLNKYFKVNPEVTTSADEKTKTYAADAAANGTNSVAIGPSAQAGDKSTDATTSTTTITGGTSSTAVGDSAKANGNQAVALGYSASVLNPSSGTSTGSTAIGSNATVDFASNAMALGTKATINETATNGLAIGNGAVTGSAKTTATKADNTTVEVAAAGGVNSVAIGTGATNAGNTSIALGDGASVTNDTDGNYQAVVKSDDIAIGTSAKTSASDSSTAIGKSASVSQSTDAVAIGSSATASSSNDALVLGKEAKAASAADSIAMGTSAAANSADVVAIGSSTSATGANSVVIGKSAQTTSEGGNAIGSSSTASGRSTAIGQSATANNFDALAIGNGATANADRSISLGYHAGVGTTEGKGETQTSGSLIAIGTEAGNNVAGMQNIAIGSSAGSDTKSNYNVAIGSSAGYNISYSDDSNNQNGYNVSIGYKANYQDTAANIMNAISIGEKTNAGNYAVAIGGEAQATGTNSIALGYKATAADTDSMALGYNSSAANGNIAIGVGSTAPKITMNTAYLTGDAAPSTYISVGTSDNLRRISNVADGSAAQDVVTVHQLTTAYTDLENTIKGIDTTSLNTYSTTAIDSKIADVKSQIANAKTKYFSYSTSTSTLAANADNTGATTTAADAMAIGPNANATNTKTLAIGNNVYAKGLRSIAIGTADNPTTDSAGTTTTHNTSAEGENSIALGTSTTAQSDNSVAIGTRAQTYTTDTTKGSITGVKAVAIGYSATTAGDTSVAVGNNATVKYASGTAVGTDSLADGTNAVAIGEGSKAYSDNSTAIGQGNSITGNNTYGLGSSNTVSGAWGSVTTSGVSGYNNSVTSVSDANTMNAISGIYITGNSNSLTQNVVNNVVSDITAMGSSNTIDAGAGGTSSHSNTLSQIAIVGSGNTVQGKSSDDSKTNNIKDVTILGYNNKVDANTDTTVDFSNTQILGSNVTAKLGNSVYLGSNAAYTSQTPAASDAITSARTAADAAAEASDAYKAATTDAEKAQIKAQYEAQYLYDLNVQAMEASGTTAGTQSYSTDETYGDGTSYTYAGSSPAGVVTVGSVGAERRIQNVAAGLVSATSTDAVNGSQLYALTRQLRFGGDNSTFGADSAADTNVIARGSAQTLAITGGAGVETNNTDGVTTITVDSSKLTDNNIGVIANKDTNALNVKLASNLTSLNTAQLGTGSGTSYKETIKLDGTGASGGSIALKDAEGTLKNTVDTTGMNLTSGAKFTSSGISAGSQQINNVKAGTSDTDAVNYGQLKNARTLLTQGTNTTLSDTVSGDQHTYTVNVDNLAVKANGTGITVALANGINFKNGTNTTSAVDTEGNVTIDTKNLAVKANGTSAGSVTMDTGLNFENGMNTTVEAQDGAVKINATHNKVSTVSAAAGNQDNVTLTLTDADGNTVTSTGLKNTYTTISKDGTAHTVTFARNDGVSETLSLGDLNGASEGELTASVATLNSTIQTEAAKASSEVTNGTNVASVTKTAGSNGQNIYTVNVDDLAVKTTDGEKKSVHLADGLVFADGTNTTATVGDNGTIKFNVSDDAIKKQAVQAVNVTGGSNVTVTPEANTDGTLKSFTISATHNALKSATLTPKSNDVSTLTITGNDGDTASVDIKNTHLTVTKDSKAKTVTFTSNDGTTPTTLSLSDFGAASTTDMTAAAAKATTEVRAGTNATLGTMETDQTDQHKIYTVNVDNLGLKQNGATVGTGTGVSLKNGLNFSNGTNTTANVTENGTVSYSVSNDAIKAQAKDAVVVAAGDNVSIDTPTDANNVKTYTVKVNDLKLQANGEDKGTRKLAEGINFADGKNTTATVEDGKVIYSLNDTLTGLTSMTAKDTAGNQTLVSGSGVTITPAAAGAQSISLTTKGLSMGGQQITNVASGGETESNAANIGDVKRLVQASASGTTETGFNVKGDDATAKKVKLGKQLNVVGRTNDTSKLSDGNIGVVTTDDGQGNATLTVKLNKNINLDSVKAGNTTLDTNGVSNGKMSLTGTGMTITNTDASKQISVTTNGVSMGSQRIQNVANAEVDTDAATLGQVKNARTVVAGGSNVAGVDSSEDKTTHQMTYTVNVDNLSVKANKEAAKSVTLKDGLTFNNGTNTTATVDNNGKVKYDLNSTLNGLTSVTAGNSSLDTNGLTIKDGVATKVEITSDNVTMGGNIIHNVGNGVDPTDAVNKGQLDVLQNQVTGGWNLAGENSDGNDVTAKIGAGKTVTYENGNYTKAVVTKDDSNNATVKVDVTTGTFGFDAGKAASVTNGLATTQDVANAINSASISVVADNTPENKTAVKAGDTIHFAKDGNLTLVQNGTTFTYGLNPEINISKVTTSDATKGSTVQTAEGITTTDAAGNTYIQNGQSITLTPKTPEDGKTAVILSNKGLNNGGNVISGVGDGTADKDAVNVSQLRKVQDQVGSGWQIAGNDGTKVADIGAGKKVTFKSNSAYLTTSTAARSGTGESDTGADVTYSLKTKALASGTNGTVASVSDADDGLATAKNVAETINQTYWTAASGKSGSGSQTDETANAADKQISAGDTVIFNAGNNLSLVQNGVSFTYGLQTDLTGMNTIRFGGTLNNGNWSGGLLIGKQAGSGANTADGNYITGLSNTKWDRATISENSSMAATEGQLKQAIENITTSGGGTGGFGLQADTGDSIMQDLRKTIQIKGDGEGSQDGNIKTSNEGGVLRIRLNKTLNLSEDGSVQIGSSKMSNGAIQLGEDADANKILMDSAKGMATVGSVTINGANKTVSGLSNTTWEVAKATQDVSVGGYKGSTKAATESQLAAAISEATTTAAQNEQHIQAGNYEVGKGITLDGKDIDKNSVAINVISGDGTKPGDVKGQVVINDVAKASDVGDTDKLSTEVKTKNGGNDQKTSVVEAVNNLNDKVNNRVGDNQYSAVTSKDPVQDGDSSTTAIAKLNNRMTDIYTTSTQHSSVSVDGNLTLDSSSKNTSGGTNYQIGLNKEKIDLGNVTFKGNDGAIEAKSMKADTFTAGNTVVSNDGVKIGDKSALTGDSLNVGGKTYVDDKGINANGKAIGNVGDGKNDTDAVNVKQLNDVKSDYKAADTKLAEAIQQTDAGLNEVGRAVNKLGNRLNRVGAGAAALAALHPGTYDPNDKWDFSAGIGHYHDANAVAIGAYYHPNDTTILSIGGSMGGGENMVNAGVTWKMGRSSHEPAPVVVRKAATAPVVQPSAPVRLAPVVAPTPVTAPVPAKTVVPSTPASTAPAVTTTAMTAAPSGDTAALTQILARQTAILEKLAQNQSQAARPTAVAHGDDIFPDVPENHWAYAYVAKLEKAGALKGFKRPAVLKSPMMTRDDFASVLYTAMANGATTNSALNGDDSLNRLAQEFKAELKDVKP